MLDVVGRQKDVIMRHVLKLIVSKNVEAGNIPYIDNH
jgi:hypothetical protein